MSRFLKASIAVFAAMLMVMGLTSCGVNDSTLSVPQSFCGFIQGKGGRDDQNNANDADLKQVLYEGQSANYQRDQSVGKFIPCVTRNFVISPEGISGDAHQYLQARTADGTAVGAWTTTYWQPNQAPDPIEDFISFCNGKYGCAANDPSEFNNGQNASTPGWNKMLAENMYPVLQRVFETAARTVDDSVWKNKDPQKREIVAKEMSDRFAEEFQKVTGSVNDIICGSGSTGTGEQFDCKQVYIVVDDMFASQGNMQQDAQAAAEQRAKNALDQQNKQADIDLTNEKYGVLAPAFRACRDMNAATPGSCKFILGPNGPVQVAAG